MQFPPLQIAENIACTFAHAIISKSLLAMNAKRWTWKAEWNTPHSSIYKLWNCNCARWQISPLASSPCHYHHQTINFFLVLMPQDNADTMDIDIDDENTQVISLPSLADLALALQAGKPLYGKWCSICWLGLTNEKPLCGRWGWLSLMTWSHKLKCYCMRKSNIHRLCCILLHDHIRWTVRSLHLFLTIDWRKAEMFCPASPVWWKGNPLHTQVLPHMNRSAALASQNQQYVQTHHHIWGDVGSVCWLIMRW